MKEKLVKGEDGKVYYDPTNKESIEEALKYVAFQSQVIGFSQGEQAAKIEKTDRIRVCWYLIGLASGISISLLINLITKRGKK